MTMPIVQCCDHLDRGWCIFCVAKLQKKYDSQQVYLDYHWNVLIPELKKEIAKLKEALIISKLAHDTVRKQLEYIKKDIII